MQYSTLYFQYKMLYRATAQRRKKGVAMLKRAFMAVGVVSLVGLALAGCAGASSPSSVAGKYLQALADGDVDSALKIQPEDTANSPLLSKDVTGAITRISNVHVNEPTGGGNDSATKVNFTYSVGSDSADGTAVLALDADKNWMFAPQNQGNELHLSTVAVGSGFKDGVASAKIANVPVKAGDRLAALPGSYDVTVEIDPRFTAPPVKPLVVTVGSVSTLDLPGLSPTDKTMDDALAAARAYVDACVKDATGKDCPFRFKIGSSGGGKWEVGSTALDKSRCTSAALTVKCTLDPDQVAFVTPGYTAFGMTVPERRDSGTTLLKFDDLSVDLLTMRVSLS
ncbi:hypothetical protein PFZ49_02005 [Microbacterium lacticum]|uniref:hypothetical protein n=1 Tax=Microbacterium lacticum TaxID=33885 RepID=UPI003A8B3283